MDFLKVAASSKNIVSQAIDRCLNDTASGFGESLKIINRDSSSAEEVSVSEVLSGKITNGKLREDDLSAAGNDLLQLLVNEFPFSINDLLEIIGVFKADLSIVTFSLKFKLNVQNSDLGVLELLRLLLETSVREGLLEGDTLNKERVSN